ncbi:hypothetical protein E2C01_002911 [Portunus trituberculatus]|uniref:Uncharacterized protein n=1 Tax=Portunus trituberculatus TaxID=210409 RepID=A0A5B7CL56_PORTR|nr:hypothetical protein [Portunus trituberculatus]
MAAGRVVCIPSLHITHHMAKPLIVTPRGTTRHTHKPHTLTNPAVWGRVKNALSPGSTAGLALHSPIPMLSVILSGPRSWTCYFFFQHKECQARLRQKTLENSTHQLKTSPICAHPRT